MTTHYTTTIRPSTLLPAFFNSSWLDRVLKHIDELEGVRSAFEAPRANYPYDVWYTTDADGAIEKYVIEIALAGVAKQDVKIHVDKTLRIVIAPAKSEASNENSTTSSRAYLFRGISHRKGEIEFALSDVVDKQAITAAFKNGMLQVVVPIRKPQQVEVLDVDIKELEG